MDYTAIITDLPVSVRIDSSEFDHEYVNELAKVGTEEELEAFTIKWKSLWQIPYGRKEDGDIAGLTQIEESIVNNTYDKTEALQCIEKGRTHICEHVEKDEHCAGINILVPPVFLVCLLISQKYEVPVIVAFVQLQISLGNLPENYEFYYM